MHLHHSSLLLSLLTVFLRPVPIQSTPTPSSDSILTQDQLNLELHEAAYHLNPIQMQQWLDRGANPFSLCPETGNTLLHEISSHGTRATHDHTVACMNLVFNAASSRSSSSGSSSGSSLSLSSSNSLSLSPPTLFDLVNAETPLKWTPLHVSARFCNAPAALHLLQHGSHINPPDLDENTPLMIAAQYHCLDVLQLLLNTEGVDVNAKNLIGQTALDYVMSNMAHRKVWRHFQVDEFMVNLLLDHGAVDSDVGPLSVDARRHSLRRKWSHKIFTRDAVIKNDLKLK